MPVIRITEEQMANIMLLHKYLSDLVKTFQPQHQPLASHRRVPSHRSGTSLNPACLSVDVPTNECSGPVEDPVWFGPAAANCDTESGETFNLDIDTSFHLWNQYIDSVLNGGEPHQDDQLMADATPQEHLTSNVPIILEPSEISDSQSPHQDIDTSKFVEDVINTPSSSIRQTSLSHHTRRPDFRSQRDKVTLVADLYKDHTLDQMYKILAKDFDNVPKQRSLKRWLSRNGISKYNRKR